MEAHEKVLRDHGRKLGELLRTLIVPEAGLPRPIIRLSGEMPFYLPVDQDVLRGIRDYLAERKQDFRSGTLVLHVQPFKDPYHRRTLFVASPFALLSEGEAVQRFDDPRPIRHARLVVPDVPSEWRTLKPLELLLQFQSPHVRHGVALGVGPVIPLRVPRQEILGKETGV